MTNKFWKIIEIIAGTVLVIRGLNDFPNLSSGWQNIAYDIGIITVVVLGLCCIYDGINNRNKERTINK